MKRIITLVLTCLISSTFFFGCGSTTTGGGKEDSKYKDRPNKVNVTYFSSGYGKAWIDNIAKEYMDNYDTETYVKINHIVDGTGELSKVTSGMSTDDIYMLEAHMEQIEDKLTELTDLYQETSLGENKKIIDKVDKNFYDFYLNDKGKTYMMPYVNQLGYGFTYNKTMLDNTFGKDNYTLPRTTDEFFEFGDSFKTFKNSKGERTKYLFVASYEDSDYFIYNQNLWFAQMVGLEAYQHYYAGEYPDGNGGWKFDDKAPSIVPYYEKQIKDWYDLLYKFGYQQNGYLYPQCSSTDFMEAESLLAGYKLGGRDTEVAFMFNGPWLENEMGFLLEDKKSSGHPQEIRTMKMPVASKIIERTPTINDDTCLRAVIDYIDGVIDTQPVGVNPDDIAIVEEARKFVAAPITGTFTIPKAASNVEGAKKFIRFCTSDKAQLIAQQAINGLPLLPYGFVASEAELGFSRTPYINDVINRATGSIHLTAASKHAFSSKTSFAFTYTNDDFLQRIFSAAGGADTSTQYYNRLLGTFQNDWSTIIKTWNIYLGK